MRHIMLRTMFGCEYAQTRARRCGLLAVNSVISNDLDDQETHMAMTTESREQVATELKRFAADLQLTEEQKEKIQTALAEGREKVGKYVKEHPATTKAEIVAKVKEHRGEMHDRLARFLTPEQLGKWDNEVAKAKEFLGQRLDS
jgi:septal ring factor EnvC (AmiA/AmiB activator)